MASKNPIHSASSSKRNPSPPFADKVAMEALARMNMRGVIKSGLPLSNNVSQHLRLRALLGSSFNALSGSLPPEPVEKNVRKKGLVRVARNLAGLLLWSACASGVVPAVAQDVMPKDTSVQRITSATALMDFLQTQAITIDLKNASLDNVLRLVAAQYDLNIVAGEGVEGKVTVSFKNASLSSALDNILSANGYGYIVDGNIIRIAKKDSIMEENKQKLANAALEGVVTEVFFLKYQDANDIKKVLDPLLSPKGKISVVLRKGFKGFQFGQIAALGGQGTSGGGTTGTTTGVSTGTSGSASGSSGVGSSPNAGSGLVKSGEGGEKSTILVVQDIPSSVALIKSIIKEIDVKPRQVLIQSRMYEVNADDLRDIGIDFATGSAGLVSTATPPITPDPIEKQDMGINTGVVRTLAQAGGIARFMDASGDNQFGRNGQSGLQLRLQKLTGSQFDALIQAIESNTDFNQLSSPRIIVLENQEAAILVGEEYPIFQVQAANIAQASAVESLSYFQPVGISLQVIPQVVGTNQINMVIHPSVSAIAGLVTGSTGLQAPRITIREADTQVIIDNKETLVIGGLMQDKTKDTVVGIPFVMDMPILGNLFKRKKTAVTKVELVIFITPSIVIDNEFTDGEKVFYQDVKDKEVIQSRNPWDVIGRKLKEQFGN